MLAIGVCGRNVAWPMPVAVTPSERGVGGKGGGLIGISGGATREFPLEDSPRTALGALAGMEKSFPVEMVGAGR